MCTPLDHPERRVSEAVLLIRHRSTQHGSRVPQSVFDDPGKSEISAPLAPRRLHSVGRYAADAYRIFVRREAEFVQPSDTYLGWFVEHRRSTAGRAPTTPLGDGSSPPDGA